MRRNTSKIQSESTPMLRYFPELLPDELLYSGICRYCRNVHDGVHTRTTWALFGEDRRWFSPFFPPWTDRLCKRIGSTNWNIESLLLDHTPLSAYYAFLPEDRRCQLLAPAKDSSSIIRLLGTSICHLHSQKPLQFCPECIISDTCRYGFPYWHCSHNLPGVLVCREHGHNLLHACPVCDEPIGNTNRFFLRPLDSFCTDGHSVIEPNQGASSHANMGFLKSFSCEIATLAFNARTVAQLGYPKYTARLQDQGYLLADGRIRLKKLCEDFENGFPPGIIQSLCISSAQKLNYAWLYEIVKLPYKRTNPAMHIMLIIFLFGSIDGFIKYQQAEITTETVHESNIQNPELFRCLNYLCPQYMLPTIKGYQAVLSRATKRTKAQYRCPHCGFTYYRYIENASNDDAPILCFREFGTLWHQQLVDAYQQNAGNIKLIKDALHITSSQQVEIHLRQAGILPKIQYSDNIRAKGQRISRAETRRKHIEKIQETITAHPDWTRSMIGKQCNSAINWLSKYQRDVLNALLPPPQRTRHNRTMEKKCSEDRMYLSLITTAYEEEMNRKPPARITLSLLGKHIPKNLTSYAAIERYPLTKTFIDTHVEAISEYHIRRLQFVVNELVEAGDYPFITRVIEKSHIAWPKAIKYKAEILRMIELKSHRNKVDAFI